MAISKAQGATEEAHQAIEFKLAPPKDAPALPLTFAKPVKAAAPAEEDEAEDVVAKEPVKRPSKKADPVVAPKDVASVLEDWGTDDE